MGLKVLILEDEPDLEMQIQHIPLADSENVETDPELPDEFVVRDELAELDDVATALESLNLQLGCEGMNLSAARELEKLSPGFLVRVGGPRVFTSSPSLEGLADGVKGVKDNLIALIQRIRKFVADMYKRFRDWLLSKFANDNGEAIKAEVEEFLAERRNRDAIKYLSELPEDPQEAADEIARWMDGDTKSYASALVDQFQGLTAKVHALEKMMTDNPTHFRLARGDVTVKELFKEDADSTINTLLKKAVAVADSSMKARNSDQFNQALENIAAVAQELDEFDKGVVVNDKPSENFGDDKAVSFDKLYDNIQQVTQDMKRVDVKQAVMNTKYAIEQVIRNSEETKIEDILEMIPEDVPEDKRGSYAQTIAALYRRIAALGAAVLRLWKVRVDAITSINKAGEALLGLVDAFEKAVVSAGGSLTPEQKTQLAKALAGKGLKIVF